MLIEALLGAFASAVVALVTALPLGAVTFPSFGPIVGLAREVDAVLPVHEAVAALGGLLGLSATIFLARMWFAIYRLLPFKGT